MSSRDGVEPERQSRPSWFRSIRTRLIVCFTLAFVVVLVLVELAGIAGIPFTSSPGRLRERKAETFRNLDLIANLKKQRLRRLLDELRRDVGIFAANDMLEENVVLLRAAGRFTPTMRKGEPFRKLSRYLDDIKRAYGVYDEIQIVDAATGRVLVSTDERAVGSDVSDQLRFAGPPWSREALIGPVTSTVKSPTPISRVSHPIIGPDVDPETLQEPDDRPIALLVMKVNTDKIIGPMLHTNEGLGKSAEVLLVNRKGKILASLKYPLPDGTVPRPLKYKIMARPAVFAAAGEEGIIDSRDYRGEPVLAAYRYIPISPNCGWGLVVKIDKAELFAPLRRDIAHTIWFSLAGILAFVGVAAILARSLTRPIRSLSQTAEKVAGGDLSARSHETIPDEVGLLATTFNAMIERVQNWQTELKDQVRDRTEDLSKTNGRLTAEVNEREQAEEQLREMSIQNELILSTAGEGIYGLDLNGHTTFVNPAAAKMIGWDPEELLGLNQHKVMHHTKKDGSPYPADECPICAAYRDGEVHRVDNEVFWRKDGSSFPVEYISTPIRNSAGEIEGAVVVFRDITARKQAEEEIRTLNAELEQRVKQRTDQLEELHAKLLLNERTAALGAIGAGIAHELNGPLMGIVNQIQYAMAKAPREWPAGEVLEDALENSRRCIQIIQDLLAYSRQDDGTNSADREEGDINSAARQALRMLHGELTAAGIDTTVQLDEHLPCAMLEESKILQVVLNLLKNARDAMKQSKQRELVLETQDRGELVALTVRDSGSGMDQDTRSRIFDTYFTTKPRGCGTGLGLGLCKSIVTWAKGSIEVDSTPGVGSTFTVLIPKAKEQVLFNMDSPEASQEKIETLRGS